jgi:hypothetical protein
MEEKIFFDEDGVTVTNTRFIVHTQTYAMGLITSVKFYEKKPLRRGPILLIIISVIAMLSNNKDAITGGIIVGVLALLWLILQKTEFQVRVRSASGESRILRRKDTNWISQVVKALNEAIIHRG